MRPVKLELVTNYIPTAGIKLLTAIEEIGRHIEENRKKFDLPPFYIAGGCIRDACVGRWPKDYDVFVPQTGDLSYLSLYSEGMGWIGLGGAWGAIGNPYEKVEGSEDWEIDNYRSRFSPYPVQFIEKPFDNGVDLIEEFDYNVVKAFWTPDGFYFHPDFIDGINSRKIDVEHERSLKFAKAVKWIRTQKAIAEDALRLKATASQYLDMNTLNNPGINRADFNLLRVR